MLILKYYYCEPSMVSTTGDVMTVLATAGEPGETFITSISTDTAVEELSVEMNECSEIEFVVPPPPPPPPPPRRRLDIPDVPKLPGGRVTVTVGVDYLGSAFCCPADDLEALLEKIANKKISNRIQQQQKRRKFASEFAEQLRASAGDSDESEDDYDLGELAAMASTNREELFSSVQQLRKVSEQLERELNARSSSFASKLLRDLDATPSGGDAQPQQPPTAAALDAASVSPSEEETDFEDFDEARFEFLMRSMSAGNNKEEEEEPISLEDMSRSAGFGCYLEPILEENSDDLRSDIDDCSSSYTSGSSSTSNRSSGKDSADSCPTKGD